MTEPDKDLFLRRHELNNLLGKILGAAELALDHAHGPEIRGELEAIIRLAEEGGVLVSTLSSHTAE